MNVTCFMQSLYFSATALTLSEHVHPFISLEGSPRGLERKEAHPWLDQSFDEAVILFKRIIEKLFYRNSQGPGMIPSVFNSFKAFGEAALLSMMMTQGVLFNLFV